MNTLDFADFKNGDDVRMIESRSGARLLLETAQSFAILRELFRQQLERDFSAAPHVFGEIYFPHPAGADQRENLIMADHSPRHHWDLLFGDHLGRNLQGGRGEEALRLLMRRQ